MIKLHMMIDVIVSNPNLTVIKLTYPSKDNDIIAHKNKFAVHNCQYGLSYETKSWLISNCKGQFNDYFAPNGVFISFSDPNDAVIFKLFHQE